MKLITLFTFTFQFSARDYACQMRIFLTISLRYTVVEETYDVKYLELAKTLLYEH